ncbi:hypothetical protein LTR94_033674, partial [Friedmanniomyces endolithicus]
MAGAHGMLLTLLDHLALLGHPLDDAVDRRLLVWFERLDVVAVPQVGHDDPQRIGAKENNSVRMDGGAPGFAMVCMPDRVPSWRVRRLDAAWPHVQIVGPCDRRLVTRPTDPHQVPRPGEVRVTARLFGAAEDAVPTVQADDGAP